MKDAQDSNRQTSQTKSASTSADWLVGGGEMGKLIRSMDWAKTPLGPIESWPQSLRTTVSLCLASDFPIALIWGSRHTQIYNDGYLQMCGSKHPHSMGQDFTECWASAWPAIGEAFAIALASESSYLENVSVFIDRNGYLEETFFTFSFSPVRDESGDVGGLFHPVTETTSRILSERRTRALRDLSAHTGKAQTSKEAFSITAQTMTAYDLDVPFILLYELDAEGNEARLAASSGLIPGTITCPATVDLSVSPLWGLAQVAASGTAVQLDNLELELGAIACGPYPEPPHMALALPVTPPGCSRPTGILIVGISSRLPFDEVYRGFCDQMAATLIVAVANARAIEEERKRAEMLADLDRAKTAFFSNVSHEFRTPLMLILGPLEESLGDPGNSAEQRKRLDIAHRNSLRLLKLVNSLLDFSSIEAGRIQATYAPQDLATCTSGLASVFRSIIEAAGIELTVECPQLPEMVYVDLDMWEKIVLNLLSNAFKFTEQGRITVSQRVAGDSVELSVEDTGTGIPPDQLGNIFKRFNRVEGTRGRTHEGTGIGLALVLELAKLHGGMVRATSIEGSGSTFTVTIPLGKCHLPADRIRTSSLPASTSTRSDAYLEEALNWLPDHWQTNEQDAIGLPTRLGDAEEQRPRVLLVDDNADMREYVSNILSSHYEVCVAPNGESALAAVRKQAPDLVLSDIMMPGLDGFGLLHELRADPATLAIPLIFLSARAGEEARVEGLLRGADDYLVKPFSSRELLARVRSSLKLGRIRSDLIRAEQDARNAVTLYEAVVESEKTFKILAEAMPQLVWICEADGANTYFNQQWVNYTGLTLEESYGPGWNKPFHPDDQQRSWDAWQNAVTNNGIYSLECRLRRKDGIYRWWLVRGVPLLDKNGDIFKWFGTCTDINDIKQAEESLRNLNQELDQLVEERTAELREKDQLLIQQSRLAALGEMINNIAHQWRQPLNSIGLAIQQLLLFYDIGEFNRELLEQNVGTSMALIKHMSATIDDFRNYFKPEKEKVEFRVSESIEQTLALIEDSFNHDHIVIEFVVEDDPVIFGYQNEYAQALLNILNNSRDALKERVTDGPKVTITVGSEDGRSVVTIADNAGGIPEEFMGKIFDPYFSSKGPQQGTGIGLFLSKSIIETNMAGRLYARNTTYGAEFRIEV